MDNRKALQAGAILNFPGMRCSVEEEIGRGSNAIVYRAWYPDLLNCDQRHIVLIKELFPFHAQGEIYRDAGGAIVCGCEAMDHMQLHRASFEHGNAAHLALLERNPDQLGANLNTFSLNATQYTVLGFSGGRSLDQEFNSRRIVLRDIAVYMIGLLDALEAFHGEGYLHLDIAPDNILLVGKRRSERILLIDYNSVHDMAAVRQSRAAYFSIKPGFTAPEIRTGKVQNICAASDLYSVAAVFYYCLTGAALTPFQTIRPTPPDVSGCSCLEDMPDTVRSMVQQILRSGLQTMPQRRYRSTEQMRSAFRELLDRIDDVGVTHWALWEAGRRNVNRLVRENSALSYVGNAADLYPANVADDAGAVVPAGEFMEKMLAPDGCSALMTAAGGMGKTTAMLRAVLDQPERYSPLRPVMVYVSLYGWKEGSASYILDRILENLKFSRETKTFEDARHALRLLMNQPIKTRSGDVPFMLILLDGLNEAAGMVQPLMEEIRALSAMAGVRLLVSSRSEAPSLELSHVTLSPLSDANVSEALAGKGLLPPESAKVRELLRTPLMLSIFMKSSEALGKQLLLNDVNELMQAYFEALRAKEIEGLGQDADARWQVDAAVSLVLPALAGRIHREESALSDQELFPVIEQCYRLISSRMMRSAFPQWVGRSREIRGEARDAEEWFGCIVHDLLWKRLGLLVRDDHGNYQLVHQMIGEYLLDLDQANRKRLRDKKRLRNMGICAALLAVLLAGTGIYMKYLRPVPYDENTAQVVFEYGLNGYLAAGSQYDAMHDLVNCALETPGSFGSNVHLYRMQTSAFRAPEEASGYARTMQSMEAMVREGDVFSWSGKALNVEMYNVLMGLYSQRDDEYAHYADVLEFVVSDPDAAQDYAAYPHRLSELIDVDAQITGVVYAMVYNSHREGRYARDAVDGRNFDAAVLALGEQSDHLESSSDMQELERTLAALQARRSDLRDELYATGAIAAYELSRGAGFD